MKYLAMLLIWVSISGCSLFYVVPVSSFEPIPENELNVLKNHYRASKCPSLIGKYSEIPETYEYADGGYKEVQSHKHVSLFLLSLYSKKFDAWREGPEINPPIEQEGHFIEFLGLNEGVLRINSVHAKGIVIHEHWLDIGKYGAYCKNGALVFPEYRNAGGGDGTFTNQKIYREAYKNSNDELLIYEQSGEWHSSLLSPGKVKVKHRIYRYVEPKRK